MYNLHNALGGQTITACNAYSSVRPELNSVLRYLPWAKQDRSQHFTTKEENQCLGMLLVYPLVDCLASFTKIPSKKMLNYMPTLTERFAAERNQVQRWQRQEYLNEGSVYVTVFLYVAQSDCKCRMIFSTMELEVFVGKVNAHSGKQRNKENNR